MYARVEEEPGEALDGRRKDGSFVSSGKVNWDIGANLVSGVGCPSRFELPGEGQFCRRSGAFRCKVYSRKGPEPRETSILVCAYLALA